MPSKTATIADAQRRRNRPLLVGIVVAVVLGVLAATQLLRRRTPDVDNFPFLSIGGEEASVLLARVAPRQLDTNPAKSAGNATVTFQVIQTLAGKPATSPFVVNISAVEHSAANRPFAYSNRPAVGQYWLLSYSDKLQLRTANVNRANQTSLACHPLPGGPDSLWVREFDKHRRFLEANDQFGALRNLAKTLFDDKQPDLSRVAAYTTMNQLVLIASRNGSEHERLIAAMRDAVEKRAALTASADPSLRHILFIAQHDPTYPW